MEIRILAVAVLQNGCVVMEIVVEGKVVAHRKEADVVVCRREVYVVGEKEEVVCAAWCVHVSASSAVMKYPRDRGKNVLALSQQVRPCSVSERRLC